jgi:hypothetical protein
MLVALWTGLCLWVVYGFAKDDWVIILANSIGAMLSLAVLCFKIRDHDRVGQPTMLSSMQPKEAGDKQNDDDDTDDVENVHCVLRLSHAAFLYECAALQ